MALYKAKQQSNKFVYYSSELNTSFKERFDLEKEIAEALEKDKLHCVYQPIKDIVSDEIIGVEALVRYKNAVPPTTFVPIVEAMDLNECLNQMVVKTVIADIKKHIAPIKLTHSFKVSINIALSAKNFEKSLTELAEQLMRAKLPKKLHLEFEITENNQLFSDSYKGKSFKRASEVLQKNGITLAIDDFGIKQSSMNRLIEYDFQTIKIDKHFIDKLVTKQKKQAYAVIRAVLSLANDLNLTVVAEGVEKSSQLTSLENLGVHLVQGFLISEPMRIEKVAKLLNS